MVVTGADAELIDWPPRTPDINSIENMWSEVKRTMQETWPVLIPRNSNELWTNVSDAWDEVASSQRYVRLLIDSMTRRMKSVVEAQGFWTSYERGQFLKTALLRAKVHFVCVSVILRRSQLPRVLRPLTC
jgi:hypothetical protein